MRGAEYKAVRYGHTLSSLKEFRKNIDRFFFYNKFTILNASLIEVLVAYLLLHVL